MDTAGKYTHAPNISDADKLSQARKFLEIILHTVDFWKTVGQDALEGTTQRQLKAKHCWLWGRAKQRLREGAR